MSLEDNTYEMPLETEDSYRIKLESGKIKKESELKDLNWIPDWSYDSDSECM